MPSTSSAWKALCPVLILLILVLELPVDPPVFRPVFRIGPEWSGYQSLVRDLFWNNDETHQGIHRACESLRRNGSLEEDGSLVSGVKLDGAEQFMSVHAEKCRTGQLQDLAAQTGARTEDVHLDHLRGWWYLFTFVEVQEKNSGKLKFRNIKLYRLIPTALNMMSPVFQNETVPAGKSICSPAMNRKARVDIHGAAELGYVFSSHLLENWEVLDESP
ncbi:hypothetical protein Anapl_18032 [Anas platyrhynchos]|uniref:Uncharacterized protein n=1 Tax=Anas platyrhynchos TaxID=8839 RepID=R0JY03_ANAPL|nr:hypothetical protein Anapl_18032 [Anas platyrhynchos]